MDKKSKILLWVLALLIVASISTTYWRIMIKKDYVIEAQVDCDPYEKNCFVWECDPESSVEGEACTGDPESDTWYFNVTRRNASAIPLCDSETDENCDPWTCEGLERDCEEILCDENNMEDQFASSCVDPVQFAIDNPIEDEEAVESECAEDDEECLLLEEESTCAEDDEECLGAEQGERIICKEGSEECLPQEETCDPEVDDC